MKKTNKKKIEEFIRVDHAGERGAIKICLRNFQTKAIEQPLFDDSQNIKKANTKN